MDANHVLVKGPHGRHIEVHKTTQAALPEAFPLVEAPKSASAATKTVESKKEA